MTNTMHDNQGLIQRYRGEYFNKLLDYLRMLAKTIDILGAVSGQSHEGLSIG